MLQKGFFRNDGLRKNAGNLASRAFLAFGSAGGHKSMAPRAANRGGTRITYNPVIKPALPAVVYCKPICWKEPAAKSSKPATRMPTLSLPLILYSGWERRSRSTNGSKTRAPSRKRSPLKRNTPELWAAVRWATKAVPQIVAASSRVRSAFSRAVRAVEEVDRCLGRVLEALDGVGGAALVTADHGNVETMIDLPIIKAGASHLDMTTRNLPDSNVRPVRRVLLIFPPMVFSRFQSRQTALFPLGLGYIGAVLERDGYDVSMIDCPSEGFWSRR